MTFISTLRKYCKAEAGVAAIEFALILPFMLFLYIGLIDATGLISANRKMTSTASVIADLVGQGKTTTTVAKINDYLLASDMINNPAPASGVTVRIMNYRLVSGAPARQWSATKSGGPGCGTVNTSQMASLMAAGNDLIVAQACMTFTPLIATVLGDKVLGAASFSVQQDIMVRPRSTTTLACTGCTVP